MKYLIILLKYTTQLFDDAVIERGQFNILNECDG